MLHRELLWVLALVACGAILLGVFVTPWRATDDEPGWILSTGELRAVSPGDDHRIDRSYPGVARDEIGATWQRKDAFFGWASHIRSTAMVLLLAVLAALFFHAVDGESRGALPSGVVLLVIALAGAMIALATATATDIGADRPSHLEVGLPICFAGFVLAGAVGTLIAAPAAADSPGLVRALPTIAGIAAVLLGIGMVVPWLTTTPTTRLVETRLGLFDPATGWSTEQAGATFVTITRLTLAVSQAAMAGAVIVAVALVRHRRGHAMAPRPVIGLAIASSALVAAGTLLVFLCAVRAATGTIGLAWGPLFALTGAAVLTTTALVAARVLREPVIPVATARLAPP